MSTDLQTSANAPASTEAGEFRLLPIGKLTESPHNPRKRFTQIDELAANIRVQGIIEPLVVRPLNGGYEVVAGARRLRASRIAGLEVVPSLIRQLSDAQVMEIQHVENLQREDLHALDEALGYRTLIDDHGYDVQKIALKFSKSPSYVYQRLKLTELIPEVQKVFAADKMSASHAVLLSRLQPKDQTSMLKEVFRPGRECSVRDLEREIEYRVHQSLESAPFTTTDASLGAAACSDCPKLDQNSRKERVCTDRSCYARKINAFLEQRAAEAAQGSMKVAWISSYYSPSSIREAKGRTVYCTSDYKTVSGPKECASVHAGIFVDGRDIGKMQLVCPDSKCQKH